MILKTIVNKNEFKFCCQKWKVLNKKRKKNLQSFILKRSEVTNESLSGRKYYDV